MDTQLHAMIAKRLDHFLWRPKTYTLEERIKKRIKNSSLGGLLNLNNKRDQGVIKKLFMTKVCFVHNEHIKDDSVQHQQSTNKDFEHD